MSEFRVKNLSDEMGQFQIFKDASGKFRFRLLDSHGNIISISNKGYDTMEKVLEAIESVKYLAPKSGRPSFDQFYVSRHSYESLRQNLENYIKNSERTLGDRRRRAYKRLLENEKKINQHVRRLMSTAPQTRIMIKPGGSVKISEDIMAKKRKDGVIVLEAIE